MVQSSNKLNVLVVIGLVLVVATLIMAISSTSHMGFATRGSINASTTPIPRMEVTATPTPVEWVVEPDIKAMAFTKKTSEGLVLEEQFKQVANQSIKQGSESP